MNPLDSVPDLDRLASCLTTELHIDSRFLAPVVRSALVEVHALPIDREAVKERIADAIEDGLGYHGDGLHNHLSDEARVGWRAQCGRAFDKALARVSGGLVR